MKSGWIKLHREMLDWEWHSKPNTAFMFIHLLLSVNWEDGRCQGHEIKAGSGVFGLHALAEKTGLSQQSIRTALNHLKSTNEITIKTTNKFSIISITNWKKYQDDNTPINKQLTNNQQTTNNIKEINNNKKERKKEREAAPCEEIKTLLPDWIDPKDWQDFTEMRNRIRKPMTARAAEGIIKKLGQFMNAGHTPKTVLENSIRNGWQDVYLPREAKNETRFTNQHNASKSERARQAIWKGLEGYDKGQSVWTPSPSRDAVPVLRHDGGVRQDAGADGKHHEHIPDGAGRLHD